MTDPTPGWAAPGANTAPATHWPPRTMPGDTGVWDPHRSRHDMRRPGVSSFRPTRPVPPVSAAPPTRPQFREPHRVSPVRVFIGAGAAVVWFLITMLLGVGVVSTLWVTIVACLFALAGAVLLETYGDRGVCVGVTAVAGAVLAVVGAVVEWHGFVNGTWILW